ncbi:MAG: Hpt domain-containing protein [Lachnospiraceae bacterium]|nr:Hpt domain-containing protein [Lachnospiraceae bacterium]
MLSLDQLKEFGADTTEGLARCMNNEAFYLKMIGMGLRDERFEAMKGVIESKDYDTAFEMAHALKGVLGNLALAPIYGPMSEMTELLRAKVADADYMSYYNTVKEQRDKLLAMIDA